jgi:hypothetical protein
MSKKTSPAEKLKTLEETLGAEYINPTPEDKEGGGEVKDLVDNDEKLEEERLKKEAEARLAEKKRLTEKKRLANSSKKSSSPTPDTNTNRNYEEFFNSFEYTGTPVLQRIPPELNAVIEDIKRAALRDPNIKNKFTPTKTMIIANIIEDWLNRYNSDIKSSIKSSQKNNQYI